MASFYNYTFYVSKGTSKSSSPAKKRVGRPTKPQAFELAQNTMEKYHNFYVLIGFYKKNDQQFKLYCKSSTSVILSPPIKTRRSFTQKKKGEVHLHQPISGSVDEKSKAFGINESTMRGMIKTCTIADNMKFSSKCNFPGSMRPLAYPVELDDGLLLNFEDLIQKVNETICLSHFYISDH